MRAHASAVPRTTPSCNPPLLLRRRSRSGSIESLFSCKITFHHRLSPPSLLSASPQGFAYKRGKTSSYRAGSAYGSSWDEKPFEFLPNGKISYLDEQDVLTFLDPPKELIPLEPTSYNPAAYVWKKIDDIPDERRHRLLNLLEPRIISRAWEIAGTRYEDPKLAKRSECNLLVKEDGAMSLEIYNCRTSEGPLPFGWINYFRKAIFSCDDGNIYGRLIGRSFLEGIASKLSPLYFKVKDLDEVMSTEQPCDFAYEFGDGLFDVHNYPHGFPGAAKHPYPFNDQVVVYVRRLGPGVAVGQAWQEGKTLEQVPRKLCSEILMVKEYALI